MMRSSLKILGALMLFIIHTYVNGSPTQFRPNDLSLSNIFVTDPFQADPTSSYNSTLSLIVADPDYPELKPVRCLLEWKAGLSPPNVSYQQCENITTRTWFPERTFNGVQNFQLQLAHTVIDTSVGACPDDCYRTKYAMVNLTYPGTPNWLCNVKSATCEQMLNTTISASLFLVTA